MERYYFVKKISVAAELALPVFEAKPRTPCWHDVTATQTKQGDKP
jgi:hypothetical protein